MIREPARRISSCSSPTALFCASSERKELEQTSSARESVTCASVPRAGRISCSTTGTPAEASCHAASLPARPPPTICTFFLDAMRSNLKPAPLYMGEPGMAIKFHNPKSVTLAGKYSHGAEVPQGARLLHVSGQVG